MIKEPKLTSNQHRLIFTVSQHIIVSIVRDGVNVRRHFSFSFVLIADDDVVVIYWKPLVRIDSDTEKTGIGVDQESDVSFGQVVDDGSFGKVSHVGQIFNQFVF